MKINSYYIGNTKCHANFSIFLLLLSLQSCVSYTGFDDGKTIGHGKIETTHFINIHQSPSITFFDNEEKREDIPIILYPTIGFSLKYGIGKKTDLYARAVSNFGFNAGFKHQLIGANSSKFALSTGADVGILMIPGVLQDDYIIPNAQIPIYASFHPSEKFALYLNPRYVYQFKSDKDVNDYHYYGSNFGVIYGKKLKFGLDLGIYSIQVRDLGRFHIYNIGVCGKYIFN